MRGGRDTANEWPLDQPVLEPGVVYADRKDDLSEVLTIPKAAKQAGVTVRTVNRWIAAGHLRAINFRDLPRRYVILKEVLECERDRHIAAHQGRPRPRVTLDTPT